MVIILLIVFLLILRVLIIFISDTFPPLLASLRLTTHRTTTLAASPAHYHQPSCSRDTARLLGRRPILLCLLILILCLLLNLFLSFTAALPNRSRTLFPFLLCGNNLRLVLTSYLSSHAIPMTPRRLIRQLPLEPITKLFKPMLQQGFKPGLSSLPTYF